MFFFNITLFEIRTLKITPNEIFIFRGAITVTMPLLNLDINQCPQKFYEPNAFKGTHKCDQRSSYVRQYLFYLLTFIFSSIVSGIM